MSNFFETSWFVRLPMWTFLAETTWFFRMWLILGGALLGLLVGNIIGSVGGDLLGFISQEQKKDISGFTCFGAGFITFFLVLIADPIEKNKNEARHLAVGDEQKEKILNIGMLKGFAIPPFIRYIRLRFLNDRLYHMIVTNKRLLFLLPSGSVWFGPAGHLARAVVGAKGYLEKHGKTENTDELDHHVLRNLLMDCSYFRGYLIDEIRDIHILNRGSAFEIELLNGRKDHFLLDSEGFEGEIDSSLSKLKALLNTA